MVTTLEGFFRRRTPLLGRRRLCSQALPWCRSRTATHRWRKRFKMKLNDDQTGVCPVTGPPDSGIVLNLLCTGASGRHTHLVSARKGHGKGPRKRFKSTRASVPSIIGAMKYNTSEHVEAYSTTVQGNCVYEIKFKIVIAVDCNGIYMIPSNLTSFNQRRKRPSGPGNKEPNRI
jgi:hypothetical protein